MKALVTGATGFIGEKLVRQLETPAALSRNPSGARARSLGVRVFAWEPAAEPPPEEALAGIDTVFHLAGDSVGKGRWSEAKKARIRSSRVDGTRHLVDALIRMEPRPSCLVSASAVGYYGDRGDEVLHEETGGDGSFLSEVCSAWEREAMRADDHGVRVVTVRTGIVLGDGGALQSMLPPFRLGLGGRLGGGNQWMPWIHVDDLVRLMLHVARQDTIVGPVNAVAPNPVTNRDFTRVLGRVLNRPTVFPVPGLILRIVLGEFATVLLGSQRAIPSVAVQSGFEFEHPELEETLADILKQRLSRRDPH